MTYKDGTQRRLDLRNAVSGVALTERDERLLDCARGPDRPGTLRPHRPDPLGLNPPQVSPFAHACQWADRGCKRRTAPPGESPPDRASTTQLTRSWIIVNEVCTNPTPHSELATREEDWLTELREDFPGIDITTEVIEGRVVDGIRIEIEGLYGIDHVEIQAPDAPSAFALFEAELKRARSEARSYEWPARTEEVR